MEDVSVVRRFVEILATFFTKKPAVEEDLTYTLTREFLQNMKDVLFAKQCVTYIKFKGFFADFFNRIPLSSELHLRHVFYACQQEALLNLEIFERFLSVFALIIRISKGMTDKSGMDFCKLVPDVFMVFYEKELEEPFRSCGGFRQFVKFVNDPKYLESKCILRIISFDPYTLALKCVEDYRRKNTQRLMREEPALQGSLNSEVAEIDPSCQSLAQKVLKITETKSAASPCVDAYKVNFSDSVQQKITLLGKKSILEASKDEGESKLVLGSCLTLSSNSVTNDDNVAQMADDKRYQNIIEATIKHNSKSCHAKLEDPILTEADRTMENLKSTINSLIQVLDYDDKE